MVAPDLAGLEALSSSSPVGCGNLGLRLVGHQEPHTDFSTFHRNWRIIEYDRILRMPFPRDKLANNRLFGLSLIPLDGLIKIGRSKR